MKALIKSIGTWVLLLTVIASMSSCNRGYGCPGHIGIKENKEIKSIDYCEIIQTINEQCS